MTTIPTPAEIKDFEIEKLRTELETRNLPTDGLKDVLVQRLMACCFEELYNDQKKRSAMGGSSQEPSDEEMAENGKISGIKRKNSEPDDRDELVKLVKRVKKNVESSLQEYVCLISHELPLDPVSAMDGQIYERCEIQKWIQTKTPPTSPSTNERMGETLIAAPRVYNAIEKLIKDGDMESEIAKSWLKRDKQRKADKKEVAETLAKAMAGDAFAMYALATWHNNGMKGLIKDVVQAVKWYKKSSDLNYPQGMALYGACLVNGWGGVNRNIGYGSVLLGRAASEGSNFACYYLGKYHLEGLHGLPENSQMTKYYWKQVVDGSCKHRHLTDSYTEKAKKWLAENE